jgi:hypothetical protein
MLRNNHRKRWCPSHPAVFKQRNKAVASGQCVPGEGPGHERETAELEREVAMTGKPDSTKRVPEAQLRAYIDKLDPKNQKLLRAVRAAVQKRFPAANELAYDYGHALVIGYSPADRGIDSIVAIRADATLYFNQGPQLPDPKRLLRGSGKQTRFIQIEAASQLKHPDVEALLVATIDQARVPLPSKGKGSLIIKSAAVKKRSRRKLTK